MEEKKMRTGNKGTKRRRKLQETFTERNGKMEKIEETGGGNIFR